ncbi:unnamed protein product [Mytilus coruscus]|uniref:Integrase catalytic domain-containing protein n=1 Tax=Mytilus coruscus TaxID=42192 RepID=A0A6J8A0C8_MYTCO|nr:unnamed protein product [Mytilus coruscus]
MCRSKQKHFLAQPTKFISATGLNNTKATNLIKIRVANHFGMAMVDSGATICAISADFYYANLQKIVPLEKAYLLATDASGATLRAIGQIHVSIEISRLSMEQTFQVFENFRHSIILGLDFLDQQKARPNFDDKTLVLQSGITEVPLTNGENNDNSICFISLINDEGIIEPNPALVGKQNIVGATCLVQIRNNKSFLQVLNPTNAKVRLSKHTKNGKFSEIIENSISSEIKDDTIEINLIDKGTQNKNNEAKYIEIAKSLNFDFSNSDLTPEQKQKLLLMLGINGDVFAINLTELRCTDLHPHRIDTGEARPVRQRFYGQSPAMKAESSKHIKEMLDNNIIEPSQSEWASPVCLGTANGNADALSRRVYDTEVVTITTTSTVESLTQTEADFIQLKTYASICEITTSTKEKVISDQQADENFEHIIKYILDKELPDITRQTRQTVIESQDYILDEDIKKLRTSSYRPQTNSTCERNNKTIAEKLRTYNAANQLDWAEKLSSIAHAMNTTVCTESTQYTPYYMVFSRECRTPIDTVLTAPTNVGLDARLFIDELHKNIILAREIAKENSLEVQ